MELIRKLGVLLLCCFRTWVQNKDYRVLKSTNLFMEVSRSPATLGIVPPPTLPVAAWSSCCWSCCCWCCCCNWRCCCCCCCWSWKFCCCCRSWSWWCCCCWMWSCWSWANCWRWAGIGDDGAGAGAEMVGPMNRSAVLTSLWIRGHDLKRNFEAFFRLDETTLFIKKHVLVCRCVHWSIFVRLLLDERLVPWLG